MRPFLSFLFLASVLVQPLQATTQPNIIVVLCDDLGYGDLACYGHPHIHTPHLDQMAAEGVRFTSFYSTAPVCSPSRVGLMTGRSPNRSGVYDWIPPANPDTARPDAREQVHLAADAITIPKLLKEQGYETCLSGKWHCNAIFNNEAQAQPDDAGFDHWFATQNNAAPSHHNPRNFVRNGEPVGELEGYSCQLATDEALAWMEGRGGEGENPFFIYLAFHEPHEPVASPPELVEGYLEVSESRDEAEYFANVENVDLAVGRLLAGLRESGKDGNTLVIFTADNGPETLNRYKSANRSWGRPDPLRGMKLWTTEAGFRVAGIARWPGEIEGGQVVETPVSALDFLPTFHRLAGAETLPEDLNPDGIDAWPAFNGEELERPKPLLWGYFNAINEQRVAMRHGDWKVLARLNGGELPKASNLHSGNIDAVRGAALTDIEIYHVADDISETRDLASENPEKLAELTRLLEDEWAALMADSHVWEPK